MKLKINPWKPGLSNNVADFAEELRPMAEFIGHSYEISTIDSTSKFQEVRLKISNIKDCAPIYWMQEACPCLVVGDWPKDASQNLHIHILDAIPGTKLFYSENAETGKEIGQFDENFFIVCKFEDPDHPTTSLMSYDKDGNSFTLHRFEVEVAETAAA